MGEFKPTPESAKTAGVTRTDQPWTVADSAELYAVRQWGEGFFDVSEQGEVVVKAETGAGSVAVPLMEIIRGMRERGLDMPSILRIENVLDDRITSLHKSFQAAIENYGYRNIYRGVFPIKVNQQCHVIEEIADYGSQYHHGFEVGSKAELIIALAMGRDDKSLIICNGFKDAEFVELGLYARQMGIQCFFVLETLTELPIILERSAALGVEPALGVRIRSAVSVEGHWSDDSGDSSIFGLSAGGLMQLVEQLRACDMLHCLQLLHCHLGSQIPNIRDIRAGVLEACRYYSGLIAEGAPLRYLDLGGGLAVDYEGSRANSTHSMNYRLDEYCANIVETVCESLDPHGIDHPVLITESGRATVAYSSLLLFDILDVRDHRPPPLPQQLPENSHHLLGNLWDVHLGVCSTNFQECYNDAIFYREEMRELFLRGHVDLTERALADNLALAVLEKVAEYVRQIDRPPSELQHLPELLSDIYYGNFSLFQSLPDVWAMDQMFPIMPIHRLDEEPLREAVIADLTCDCDGKINSFSTGEGIRPTLRLHPLRDNEDYYLGVFLIGAYQETLGDLHNLFADTNVVSIHINADGSFDFKREFRGDSIADVLKYVEYDPQVMEEQFRKRAESAVRSGLVTASQRRQMMNAFRASLDGYTYFEKEDS
ncbi:MAG: biosynthetic arginine decarboxylase [Gammaproteobacteria bacterium]|nr:biosynthetic arginine decarboxylase [Gammaproteobacteria bacterium]